MTADILNTPATAEAGSTGVAPMLSDLLPAMKPTTLATMIADCCESGANTYLIGRLIDHLIALVGKVDAIDELASADVPERYWPEQE